MDLKQIYDYTVAGNPSKVAELTRQALKEGVVPNEIISQSLIPAMTEVGRRFERCEFFLPEMLVAARAMQEAMAILKPHLTESDRKGEGLVVIGTVKGDLHDIGKNLVAMMMEGTGLQVVDLGINVPAERFVAAVKGYQPQIVAMSALLSTTMLEMRTTIQALEAAGVRGQAKILVGGAPVRQEFADQIGADGYAPDASSAVRKAKELLKYQPLELGAVFEKRHPFDN